MNKIEVLRLKCKMQLDAIKNVAMRKENIEMDNFCNIKMSEITKNHKNDEETIKTCNEVNDIFLELKDVIFINEIQLSAFSLDYNKLPTCN